MKIYFAGSIRGGRQDRELYAGIIELLKKYGEVLTEHIGDQALLEQGEANLTDEVIFVRDMDLLEECDVLVAEVTTPSLGVGYEIGWTESRKPVLCLFRKSNGARLSAMIAGNGKLKVADYDQLSDLENILTAFLTDGGHP